MISRLSASLRGLLEIGGVLLGVHKTSPTTRNVTQLTVAGWVFLFGVPVGFLFFGPLFPLDIWAAVVLICLCFINLDTALLLISRFADEGISAVLDGETA